MTYRALYREWRPRGFKEVVGQDHIVRTLVNALKGERLSHAYLFCGPRGTGKTSIAKILARAVNCREPREADPCGRCDLCRDIAAGTSMDVIEIDAASNRGIDEVRDLREKVKFAPSGGKFRVFIVDEVHMLTNEAFNALLKTLEEPPSHAMFILATTEPHRIPLTILSRCQRFDFHRIGDREMTQRIKTVAEGSGIEIEQPAVDLIVRAAEGGMRDALGILDQAAAYGGNRVGVDEIHGILGTVREDLLKGVASGLMGGQAGEVLGLIGEIADQGKDLRVFVKDLNAHLRGLMLEKLGSAGAGGDEIECLSRVIGGLSRAEQDMRWSTQPRILLEVALVRAARLLAARRGSGDDHVGELAARIRELESRISELSSRVRGLPGPKAANIDLQPATVAYVPAVSRSCPAAEPSGPVPSAVRENASPPQEPVVGAKIQIPPPATKNAIRKKTGGEKELPASYHESKASNPGHLFKTIDSRWNDVLEMARRLYPNIATHLTQGKGWPLEVEGNTLTIAFPRSESYAPLAVMILENETNRRELSDLIKSVCKEDIRLRLVEADGKPPGKVGLPRKIVRPDDVEALFGKGEESAEEDFEVFDP